MTKPIRKKKGGQPKNNNAVTNGIYAQFITLKDTALIKGMSNKSIKDELSIARVNFKKSMDKRDRTADDKGYLAFDFAAHYWLETIINAKLRSAEAEQTAIVVYDSLIAAMRAANDKQAVKK